MEALIDKVYDSYRERLQHNGGDVLAVVLDLIDSNSRKSAVRWIEEMSDAEVVEMLGLYLLERLKARMAQDEGVMSAIDEQECERQQVYLH
ncbi:MAG: hypothetical protein RLZ12_249 [Bacillota bacterium]|jgi:hypothetical protein